MNIYGPRITDERLRSWLDTNQLDRERMCQALLSLDPRFTNVVPRHPRGGRDGGRDLEAMYEGALEAWGAIGFRNTVSDSPIDKRETTKKFKTDLKRALEENTTLQVFVFMTNVELTVGEKKTLEEHARKLGINECHIYDRERLRILLDSPDGLGLRYQYLRIPLSEAEQATFFGRWGRQLEDLVVKSFREVENRLARIEFNQSTLRPLRQIGFRIRLRAPTPAEDLGHFRAIMLIVAPTPRPAYKRMYVGACSGSGRFSDPPQIEREGLSSAFWTEGPDALIQTGSSLRPEVIQYISESGGFSEWLDRFPHATLGDLQDNFFLFYITKPLVEHIEQIEIIANGYVLWDSGTDGFIVDDHVLQKASPFHLTSDEVDIPLQRMMSRHGSEQLDLTHGSVRRFRWAEGSVGSR